VTKSLKTPREIDLDALVAEAILELSEHSFFKSRAIGQRELVATKILLLETQEEIVDLAGESVSFFSTEISHSALGAPNLVASAKERALDRLNVMTLHFIENDPLLSNASEVIVVYLLVQALTPALHNRLRPLLLSFDNLRRLNRSLPEQMRASEVMEYEILVQAGDNIPTLSRKLEILKQRAEQLRHLPSAHSGRA
jgi:hypothetical protein